MMSIEYIQAMADEATLEAKRNRVEPRVLGCCADTEEMRDIPNLGNYVAPGWEHIEDLFVDSSGFGAVGEPALTFGQYADFIEAQEEETGYGIRQAGQFQVYIGVYRRTS